MWTCSSTLISPLTIAIVKISRITHQKLHVGDVRKAKNTKLQLLDECQTPPVYIPSVPGDSTFLCLLWLNHKTIKIIQTNLFLHGSMTGFWLDGISNVHTCIITLIKSTTLGH